MTARDVIAEIVADYLSAADRAYKEHQECADKILAALLSARDSVRLELAAMLNPWRPIETAPKNTPVLVCQDFDGPLPRVAMKLEGKWYKYLGAWRTERTAEATLDPGPTHWLPLPAPPSEEKE